MTRKPAIVAVILLLAVYLAGVVTGVASEDRLERIAFPGEPVDEDYDDDLEDVIEQEERLVKSLWLNSEQQQTVTRLMAEREARLVGYWDQRMPDMHAIIDSSRAEIRRQLDSAQVVKYDAELIKLRQALADR